MQSKLGLLGFLLYEKIKMKVTKEIEKNLSYRIYESKTTKEITKSYNCLRHGGQRDIPFYGKGIGHE